MNIQTAFVSLVFVLGLSACGGGGSETSGQTLSAETAAEMSVADMGDRLIDDTQELAEILRTIDSEASAEAAQPRLEAMIADYKVLQTRLETLDETELGMGDAMALARRMPALGTNAQAIATELERLRVDHPELSDKLGRILDEL